MGALEKLGSAAGRRALKLGACIAMAATSMGLVGTAALTAVESGSKIEEARAEAASLERELEELEGAERATPGTVRIVMKGAQEAGENVARIQSSYQDAAGDAAVAVAERMDDYLAEGSENARTPWFKVTKGDAKAVWEFVPTYHVAGGKQPVMWICRASDAADKVLAFATGTYDSAAGAFSDMKWRVCSAASPYTGDDSSDGPSNMEVLIEEVEKGAEGKDLSYGAPTEEEAAQIGDVREAMRKQQEEAQNA